MEISIDQNLSTRITQSVETIVKDAKIPGLSISVQRDAKIIYQHGFGLRNLEKILPMNSETLYGIASTSKTFTALAIMQLVEKGKIRLDSPISDYIDFKLGSSEQPITIHHCLSHSSGIPELNADAYYIHSLLQDDVEVPRVTTREELLAFINGAQAEIAYPPGEKFMYNNDMFKILSLVLESVTGENFGQYVQNNILKPLDMNRSGYNLEEIYQDPNVIMGYLPGENELMPFHVTNNELTYPDGGIFSSDNELHNFISMLLNQGKYKDKEIISPSFLSTMCSPQNALPKNSPYGNGHYGYGIFISDFFGHRTIGHGGNFGVMSSDLLLIPDLNMGITVGMNIDGGLLPGTIAHLVLGYCLGKEFIEVLPTKAREKELAKFCGTYYSYNKLSKADIRFHGGILWCEFLDVGPPEVKRYPLIPEDIDNYKFKTLLDFEGLKLEFNFTINEGTKMVHLQFDRHYLHKNIFDVLLEEI